MSLFKPAENSIAFAKLGFMGEAGAGKAQPVDCKVLTPTGFRRMGSLKVGDYVIGGDGMPCKVVGVYPQGRKPVFRITFSDKTSTLCCDEHLWVVRQAGVVDRGRRARWSVLPLKEIMELEKDRWATGTKRLRIPVCGQVEYASAPALPMHPYVLGALLGDGGFTERGVKFSTGDPSIIERMEDLEPGIKFTKLKCSKYDYYVRGAMEKIAALGLKGCNSGDKFIPEEYLRATVDDRYELLRGLFDTDGHRNRGYVDFTVKSERLAVSAAEVARSLGYLVTVTTRAAPKIERALDLRASGVSSVSEIADKIGSTEASVVTMLREADLAERKPKGHGGYYRVIVRADDPRELFNLPRKQQGSIRQGKYPANNQKMISLIEPAGEEVCRCIAVTSPDRTYITDDFIVTHNTHSAVLFTIGLIQYLKTKKIAGADKPVYFLDTEQGSAWVKPMFDKAGIPLHVAKTRAFKDLVAAVNDAEKNASALLIDSITHFWEDLQDSYKAQRKRNDLQFQDWAVLKKMWRQFSDRFVNSNVHCVLCGRLGFEYDQEADDRGKKQIVKSGVKMQAEKNLGYEPNMLVWMERELDLQTHVVTRTATILKDRSQKLDGKRFPNPTFKTFLPHIEFLALGGKHEAVDTTRNSEDIIPEEDEPVHSDLRSIRRQIVIDQIDALLAEHQLSGQNAETKARRAELVKAHFHTVSRTEIERLMPLEELQQGYDSLHRDLTGKASQYGIPDVPTGPIDEIPNFDDFPGDRVPDKKPDKASAKVKR